MAHEHSVYDNDKYFKIDPVTRQIENTTGKVVLIQHDHDSERFTFEIPKTVEDHDMSKCNVVQIHFLNVEAATGTDNEGIYEVDDLQVSQDDADVVVCSWLISRNATQYVGSLNFVVRFKCVEDDGTVSYEWATAIHKGIAVSDSIYNSEVIVSEYADVLEKWRASLFFNTDGVTEDIAMSGNKITGMGEPTEDTDGATKAYVDNAVKNIDLSGVDAADKVSKAGDIMAGQLDMNTNKIIGLGTPTDGADAATKAYVDEQVVSIDVTNQLNALSEEIMAEIGELTTETAKKFELVKLWENASKSSFTKQTITVTGLAQYDFALVVASHGGSIMCNDGIMHAIVDGENGSDGLFIRVREVKITGNSVYFDDCGALTVSKSSSVYIQTGNDFCVPHFIYGIRGLTKGGS